MRSPPTPGCPPTPAGGSATVERHHGAHVCPMTTLSGRSARAPLHGALRGRRAVARGRRASASRCCSTCGSVTLSRPEASAPGPLARRDGEPVFDEPWQAQVMALAFALMERGVFTNARWSEALGAELQAASARHEPDNPDHLLSLRPGGPGDPAGGRWPGAATDLAARTEAWRSAYLNTPHGQPVNLPASGEVCE